MDKIKSNAITYSGYIYQTIYGISILAEWLEAPQRYVRIAFEADNKESPEGIDDIVAECNGKYRYWQVKFTVNENKYKLDTKWLLDKGKNKRSNIRKWYDAVKKIASQLDIATLVTNRMPCEEIETAIEANKIVLEKLSADSQQKLIKEIGNEDELKWFFSVLTIKHSEKNLSALENDAKNRILRFTHENQYNELLHSAILDWAIHKDKPTQDGWITYNILQNYTSNKLTTAIQEDFLIPEYYEPDNTLHESVKAQINNHDTVVVTGTPGSGKSTYLSYMYRDLLNLKDTCVLRHHYFLSLADTTRDRITEHTIVNTFITQAKLQGVTIEKDTHSLSDIVNHIAGRKKLYIIIDGLDHVWRENAEDIEPLNDIFNQLFPLPSGAKLLVGTQQVADNMLPIKLLQFAPKAEWFNVPNMSSCSLCKYLEYKVKINRNDLQKCANAIYEKTLGHALTSIYYIEELISRNELNSCQIKESEFIFANEIGQYYHYLWARLGNTEKHALILMSTFDIFWRPKYFTEILDKTINFTTIKHLLIQYPSGYKAFHESLYVYIRKTSDYQDIIDTLCSQYRCWIENKSPNFIRNTSKWLINDGICEKCNQAEFAKVSWQLGDVLEATKERGISLTEQEAAELLEGIKKRLSEAMIATGWGVIYETLSELKPKLLSKIRELASKLQYPSLAVCNIRFLDDNTTKIVTIALYDNAPDEDDETVFYYAGSVSGLISLAHAGTEDFIITDVLFIE